ncbi:unnamed protein product, partial [Chrysoparadoxa australica]
MVAIPFEDASIPGFNLEHQVIGPSCEDTSIQTDEVYVDDDHTQTAYTENASVQTEPVRKAPEHVLEGFDGWDMPQDVREALARLTPAMFDELT